MSVTETKPLAEQAEVDAAFARLALALVDRLAAFSAVGGDISFFVPGATPPRWHVTSTGATVTVAPGSAPFPIVSIGATPRTLVRLLNGTLDVAKAFRSKRLAIEGDFEALRRFVQCFAAP